MLVRLSLLLIVCVGLGGPAGNCFAEGESAKDLLDSLLPDEETTGKYERLVGQLGSEKFKERKAAMDQLMAAPVIPERVIQAGLKSGEPEVVERVKEIVAAGGAKRGRAVFGKALVLIEKEKANGLLARVVAVMESGITTERAGQAVLAAGLTTNAGDLELLRRIASSEDVVLRRMAAAGGELLKESGVEILESLVEDSENAVKLRAAIGLGNLGKLEGPRALCDLLETGDNFQRFEALNALRAFTGKELGFVLRAPPEVRAEGVEQWRKFLQGDYKIVGGVDGNTGLQPIQLFNGRDLEGWTQYRQGVAVAEEDATWKVVDGILVCPGNGPGDLRCNTDFKDYILRVSYRAAAPNADSGIGVMLNQRIKPENPGPLFARDGGAYLEVQLLPGRTGDLYVIGGFGAKAGGKRIPFSQRRNVEVKEDPDAWHEARLEVSGGTVRVFVNGVLVNEAEGTKEPGKILLREEQHRFEFKEITLLRLSD